MKFCWCPLVAARSMMGPSRGAMNGLEDGRREGGGHVVVAGHAGAELEEFVEANLNGEGRAGPPGDRDGLDFGHVALEQVGVVPEELLADDEPEDGVTEEFEPLIGIHAVRGARSVGEGPAEELGVRERVPEELLRPGEVCVVHAGGHPVWPAAGSAGPVGGFDEPPTRGLDDRWAGRRAVASRKRYVGRVSSGRGAGISRSADSWTPGGVGVTGGAAWGTVLGSVAGTVGSRRAGSMRCRQSSGQCQEATVHYPKRVSRIKRKRSIGFRARMRTRNGRKMINRKRRAGRSVNSV